MKLLTTTICLFVVPWCFHWQWTWSHTAVAVSLMLSVAFIAWWWRSRMSEPFDSPDSTETGEAWPWILVRGGVTAIAIALLVQQLDPWLAPDPDQDREMFTMQLSATEQGNLPEAVELIQQRFNKPLSDAWRKTLLARLYHNALRLAQQRDETNFGDRETSEDVTYWATIAQNAARRGGLQGLAVEALLQNVDRKQKTKSQIQAWIANADWTMAATRLRLLTAEEGSVAIHWAPTLYRVLLKSVEMTGDETIQQNLLNEALRLAQSFNLDATAAEVKLAGIQQLREQRESHRHVVRRLSDAAQYRELVTLLKLQLEQAPTDREATACQELIQALVRWSNASDSLDEQRAILRDAATIAAKHHVEAPLVQAKLAAVERSLHENQRIRELVVELRNQQAYNELTAMLRAEMQRQSADQWPHPYAQWLYQAWMEWGARSQGIRAQQCFQSALTVAQDYQLPTEAVRRQLTAITQSLAPKPLSPTVQFVLRGSAPAQYPMATTDFYVRDRDKHIAGLQKKDLQVSLNGRVIKDFGVTEMQTKVRPLHLVIALDLSKSVAGQPLSVSLEGAKAFLQEVAGRDVHVRVIGFNDRVVELCDWTTDLDFAARSIKTAEADGATALFASLHNAVASLRSRAGELRVLVFTDGKDSHANAAPVSLMQECRRREIELHAIGLKTPSLDRDVLQQLATITGGMYAEAISAKQVVESYRHLAQRISQPFYRISIRASDADSTDKENALVIQAAEGMAKLSAPFYWNRDASAQAAPTKRRRVAFR